jgi:hypothetical protein
VLAPRVFGADADTFRRAAEFAADGRFDYGLLYPPLAALAFRPLTWVSPTGAAVAMTLLGLAILLAGVRLDTRGGAPVDRVLVAVAALGFAPVVYELLLGQVTFLIAAALYPLARRADAYRFGAPVGIALALAPKPLLLLVLVWMVVWRRRALAVALPVALGLTCLGIALLGLDPYRQWVQVLTGAGSASVSGTFQLALLGNFSLWPLDPMRLALAVAVAAATLWAILRDPSRGLAAALLASLLLAPYTGLYSATILLLVVKPALAFAPRATRALALAANVALALALALAAWSLAALAACLPIRYATPVAAPEPSSPTS